MERVIVQAQSALETAPPDPEQASKLLEQAEAQDWFTPAFHTAVARLRGWIASQEQVAQAARLLEQDERDVKQALEMLKEAHRLLPEAQSDEAIHQWELLARAVQAWRVEDLDTAEKALRPIQPPVAEVPRARRLQAALTHARQVAQALRDARRQVEEALSASPPRHEEAVTAVIDTVQAVGDDASQFQQDVQTRLQRFLEDARQVGRYAEAIALGGSLRRLVPGDEEVERLVRSLPGERRDELDKALRQAEESLQANRLRQIESALRRAKTIAAPEGDPRLDDLRQRCEQRRQVMEQVDGWLREVHAALGRRQWKLAVERLLDARSDAPRYQDVVQATADLQNQLHDQASIHLEASEFNRAMELCGLALQVRPRDDVLALQRRVQAARDAFLAGQRQQVESALQNWDLEAAEAALQRGLDIPPTDAELLHLQERWQEMSRLASVLKRQMAAGWEALRERSYPAAQQAFAQVLKDEPHFREAQLWRDYTVNLEQAVQAIQSNGFQRAQALLERAEGQLRFGSDDQLPVVLSNLQERRRQAVWDAAQLRKMAGHLTELRGQYARYESLLDQDPAALRQAHELQIQIQDQQKEFLRRHQAPTALPSTFRAERPSAVSARGPREPVVRRDGEEFVSPPIPEPTVSTSEPDERIIPIEEEPMESVGPADERPAPAVSFEEPTAKPAGLGEGWAMVKPTTPSAEEPPAAVAPQEEETEEPSEPGLAPEPETKAERKPEPSAPEEPSAAGAPVAEEKGAKPPEPGPATEPSVKPERPDRKPVSPPPSEPAESTEAEEADKTSSFGLSWNDMLSGFSVHTYDDEEQDT